MWFHFIAKRLFSSVITHPFQHDCIDLIWSETYQDTQFHSSSQIPHYFQHTEHPNNLEQDLYSSGHVDVFQIHNQRSTSSNHSSLSNLRPLKVERICFTFQWTCSYISLLYLQHILSSKHMASLFGLKLHNHFMYTAEYYCWTED